jgi:hypothetical protein
MTQRFYEFNKNYDEYLEEAEAYELIRILKLNFEITITYDHSKHGIFVEDQYLTAFKGTNIQYYILGYLAAQK